MTTIISVHIPKTGGSSFRRALEEHFKERLLLDYSFPLGDSKIERRKKAHLSAIALASQDLGNFECVHGHFLPAKYLLLSSIRTLRFVVWIREPVSRLVSHYHYWRENKLTANSTLLHRRMIEEGWSLEQFCLAPELQNLYAEFLWGFPIEYFDFIGLIEDYRNDIQRFSKNFFNTELPAFHLNRGSSLAAASDLSPNFRREIETYHSSDMDIYRRALLFREKAVGP